MIGMDKPVAALQIAPVCALVDLDSLTYTHRGSDSRQQHGVGIGEWGTLRRDMKAGLHHIDPRQPSPPAPEVQCTCRNARYGNGRGSDLVWHLLSDEHHFDGCPGAAVLAIQPGNADKEVHARHFTGAVVVARGEAAAAQPREDGFRRAADQHHTDGGVHRAAALLQPWLDARQRRQRAVSPAAAHLSPPYRGTSQMPERAMSEDSGEESHRNSPARRQHSGEETK